MSAYAQAQQPVPTENGDQIKRLRLFSTWYLIATTFFAAVGFLTYALTSVPALALIGSIGVAMSVAICWARVLLARGAVGVAALIMGGTVLVAATAATFVIPALIPAVVAAML